VNDSKKQEILKQDVGSFLSKAKKVRSSLKIASYSIGAGTLIFI
jgi:hypothetical protein